MEKKNDSGEFQDHAQSLASQAEIQYRLYKNYQQNSLKDMTFKIKHSFQKSLVAKLIMIGIISLIMLIPVLIFSSLVHDRQRLSNSVQGEVSRQWGGRQTIVAPVLSYDIRRSLSHIQNINNSNYEYGFYHVLPETLKVKSSLEPEIRYRGIYQVRLYKSSTHIEGQFVVPDTNNLGERWNLDSGNARLLFYVDDIIGIKALKIKCDGKELKNIPGIGRCIVGCDIDIKGKNSGTTLDFELDLELNGWEQFRVMPIGKEFEMEITSSWPHPNFTGSFLPYERKITEKGFSAEWKSNEINFPFSRKFIEPSNSNKPEILFNPLRPENAMGVDLVHPGDTYRQVNRALDYAFLVIGVVMISFLIGEKITGISIHPLQYFFTGLSLVFFYLLLLALSEHIPFYLSYVITTIVIAGLTTGYCRMIFSKRKSAAILLGGITILSYALIFVLTRLEDYALLAGSIVMLCMLAVLMKYTGNLNKIEENE